MLDLKGKSQAEKIHDLNEVISQVAEAAEKCASAEDFKRYMRFMATFHKYSWNNTLLIGGQRPDAERVAGFRAWEKLGRHVVKGSRGIAILVPMGRVSWLANKKEVEKEAAEPEYDFRPRFGVGYVFDVKDTDGDPLPTLDIVMHQEEDHGLFRALVGFASLECVTVQQIAERESWHGDSAPGRVRMNSKHPLADQAASLAHELAHEYLHQRKNSDAADRGTIELEAEAAAAVVAIAYDLEPTSDKYLAVWSNGSGAGKKIMERLERVREAANWILEGLENNQARTRKIAEALSGPPLS